MKRIVTVALLLVLMLSVCATKVNAATSKTLPDELYAIGSKYGMRVEHKIKMEKYLSEYPLSDADCNRILALAKEAERVMIEHNEIDCRKLPSDAKEYLKSLVNQAAAIAGVTVVITPNYIEIYKDGKLFDTISVEFEGRLVYTGNNINTTLIVSVVAVVALAAAGIKVAKDKKLVADNA